MECIDIHKAKKLIEDDKITIIDIRDNESYAQGHIDRAVSISDRNVEEFIRTANKDIPLI